MRTLRIITVSLGLTCVTAPADTHYVWTNSPSPMAPFTSWETAAHVIQDAVDAATNGDTVLVTNGVYYGSTRVTPGYLLRNRLVVTSDIAIRSVNGAEHTSIVGQGPLGDDAVRCVYMSAGVLSGFTLTNGHTRTSGHYAEDLSGGGAHALGATLNDCTISGNSAEARGGGTFEGTLNNCTISGNSAGASGGGAGQGSGGTLNNCTISGKTAGENGGGMWQNSEGTLNNCAISGNRAGDEGGGTWHYRGASVNNCTISGNSACRRGGGSYAHGGTFNNCILYHNTAVYEQNYGGGHWGLALNYSCTTPRPGGEGNITDEPMLASASHLSSASPCISVGSYTDSRGTDIDGEAWLNPPCMGCDQVAPGAVTGLLSVAISAEGPQVVTRFASSFRANIAGRVTWSTWSFGDGTTATNEPFTSHAWNEPGQYPVVLRVRNETYPAGVAATVVVSVVEQPTRYVNPGNPAPRYPYGSWPDAATNIQDAIDACRFLGERVLVTNGIYDSGGVATPGGLLTSRIVVDKPLEIRSVGGPKQTFIVGAESSRGGNGGDAVRCVYMNGGVLSGFTLTNGHTRTTGSSGKDRSGGGAYALGSVLDKCELIGNSADFDGGGAYLGTLSNCTIIGNAATWHGGGASYGMLDNCTLTANEADTSSDEGRGGGAADCTLTHCVISGNLAGRHGGGAYRCTLNSCTISGNRVGYMDLGHGGGVSFGTLSNCAVAGNRAVEAGGGAYRATLNNCAINGNSVVGTGSHGGGAADCTLNNCVVAGNRAVEAGGGAYGGMLNHCTITDNSAVGTWSYGGGTHGGTLGNCIVYFNTAVHGPDRYGGTLAYCCTPLDAGGTGNTTNDPRFVDAVAGDYHLSARSPCIDAGGDLVALASDLDGVPRPLDGDADGTNTVDMGCYEFVDRSGDSDGDLMTDGFEIDYALDPTDPADQSGNADNDPRNNREEFIALTDPRDPTDFFRIAAISNNAPLTVYFESASNRVYALYGRSSLTSGHWVPITERAGRGGSDQMADTNRPPRGPFYRMDVALP